MKSYVCPEYIIERDPDKCIRCKVCVNQCSYDTHCYDEEEDCMVSKNENCGLRSVVFCRGHAQNTGDQTFTYSTM